MPELTLQDLSPKLALLSYEGWGHKPTLAETLYHNDSVGRFRDCVGTDNDGVYYMNLGLFRNKFGHHPYELLSNPQLHLLREAIPVQNNHFFGRDTSIKEIRVEDGLPCLEVNELLPVFFQGDTFDFYTRHLGNSPTYSGSNIGGGWEFRSEKDIVVVNISKNRQVFESSRK